MKTSETTQSLFKAMIASAPEITSIGKSKQAYGYKYATLDDLIDMLRAVLPKHGLWFTQTPSRIGDISTLTTRVFHESGEWFEDSIEMTNTELQGKANDTQKIGASITYYRRYALSSIFGVSADEDVDGNLANVQTTQRQQPRQVAQPQAPKQEKKDPVEYINAILSQRINAGETPEKIYKDFADILKTDDVRPVHELTDLEKVTLARELYKMNKEKNNVQ